MKIFKSYSVLALMLISFSANCQINPDTIWKNNVLHTYENMQNYLFSAVTKSTIKGDWKEVYVGDSVNYIKIDTTKYKTDSITIFVERKDQKVSFLGAIINSENDNIVSFTQNDTNTTINIKNKWVAINSIQNLYGQYLNDKYFFWEIYFCRFLTDRGKGFKKIDKISDVDNYFVFECVDSSLITNDVKMYYSIKMYVNKENYLLKRITAKLLNNIDIDELDFFPKIEQEITINYLEINKIQPQIKKEFDTNNYKDYFVVKGNFPWKNEITQKKNNFVDSIWNQEPIEQILKIPLTDFEGKLTNLSNFNGWLLLDSWFSTCPPCYALMKTFQANKAEFEKRGITTISINLHEQPTEMIKTKMLKQVGVFNNIYFTLSLKTKLNDVFSNYAPSLVLLSPEKKVVYHSEGNEKIEEILFQIDKAINSYNKTKK
jgi:thiol-disulfide isomerase/thioredoxin